MINWVQSFESQLLILRPHLTQRVLSAMSLGAWNKDGVKDVDPIKAAKALHSDLATKKP